MKPTLRQVSSFTFALVLFAAAEVPSARASGGPENVFLVINSRSWASVCVGNHYAKLRSIPSSNVLFLDWPGPTDVVDLNVFRQGILDPIVQALAQRGLLEQIDAVVYSSDFPWSVDFSSLDLKPILGDRQLNDAYKTVGSLTSMTYFTTLLQRNDPTFFLAGIPNGYYRRPAASGEIPSLGFRGWCGYGADGAVLEVGGSHYLLSSMIAFTSGRGTSVREALAYLNAAAKSDATKPKGTIYFARANEIRTAARDVTDGQAKALLSRLGIDPSAVGFSAAVEALKKLNVNAEIVAGSMPMGKPDVQGAMMGVRDWDWKASRSTILPGAFCDNFTSFAGILGDADQPPLTGFLRYGAAGSSGTVVEPLALPTKFPAPFIHVHYARGCTLAEAFYQSVASPWQQLFVGDPMCRPWAEIPTIQATGVESGATVKGTVQITPTGGTAGGSAVDRFELYVDGLRLGHCVAGESFDFDTTRVADGYHLLSIGGNESSSIATRGQLQLPVQVSNHERTIEFSLSHKDKIAWGQTLTFKARSPGAKKIFVYQGARAIKEIKDEEGSADVPAVALGLGPTSFRAVGVVGTDGMADQVNSAPVEISIGPTAALPGRKMKPGAKLAPGLQLKPDGAATVVVPRTDSGAWLTAKGVKPGQKFTLVAIFEVPEDDIYQFQPKFVGPLKISVDRQTIFDQNQQQPAQHYVPAPLAKGLHEFRLEGQASEGGGVQIRFGGQGTANLDGSIFRHPG